jgi:DNA-binding beta-propeller fold protein YncE
MKLYVIANEGDADSLSLYVIDCETNTVIDSVGIGTRNLGRECGVYCQRERKFYTRGGPDSENLVVIDVATDSVLRRLPLPGALPEPQTLVYHSTTNRLYIVANDDGRTVIVLNCANDSFEKLIPDVGVGRAVWDSLEDKLYVDNHTTGLDRAIVIDCSTNTVIDTVDDCPEAYYAVSFARRHRLYCPGEWGSVGIVNTETDSLVTILPIQTDPYRAMLVCNEQEDKLYIGGRPNGVPSGDSVYVLDCAGDSVRAAVEIDSYCGIASVALAPWSNRLYCLSVTNGDAGLSVLDCATDSVVGRTRIQVQYGAGTLAAHPDNHRIYLAAYWESCVYVFRDEPNGVTEPRASTPPPCRPGVTWHRSGDGIVISLGGRPECRLEVTVHDLSGRRVRTLRQMASASGPTELYWDARDQTGASVSPGIYFISVQDAEGLCRAKVTLP